jgi:hypothetical protein
MGRGTCVNTQHAVYTRMHTVNRLLRPCGVLEALLASNSLDCFKLAPSVPEFLQVVIHIEL